MEQKKILITCFEPFGIWCTNTSKKVLEKIKRTEMKNLVCEFYSFRVYKDFIEKEDLEEFQRILDRFQPNYIMSMGEYIFHIKITLERIENETPPYLFDIKPYDSKVFKEQREERNSIDGACLQLRNYIIDYTLLHNIEGCEFLHIPKFSMWKKKTDAITNYLSIL